MDDIKYTKNILFLFFKYYIISYSFFFTCKITIQTKTDLVLI